MPITVFVNRLLANSGGALPDNAWRAAAAAYGDRVFEHPAPDAVVRERLADNAKLPATAAKAIAKYTTAADVASALASDRRVGVHTELAAYWHLTPEMVDALVTAGCKDDIAARLGDLVMPADTRSRLWTRMRHLDALADAAREPQAATAAHMTELLCRDDIDSTDCVPYVVRIVEHHPQVVDDVIERARPAVLAALACTRLGTDRAERILDNADIRFRGADEVHLAVADHPGVPLEVAQRALAVLDEAGSSVHLRLPVEPTVVPRVPTVDDWDDHAARVVLLRDNTTSSFQRRFHLRELYRATHLDPSVLRTAAVRIAGALGYTAGYRQLFTDVEDRLRADLGRRADSIFDTRFSHRSDTPRTGDPLEEPVRARRSTRTEQPRKDTAHAAGFGCGAVSSSDAAAVAAYLADQLGDDIASWRLLLQLHGGFQGTVGDLVAMVTTVGQ